MDFPDLIKSWAEAEWDRWAKGAAIGGGLVVVAAFFARGSSSLGRYLSPDEDAHTVASEFVNRLERGYDFAEDVEGGTIRPEDVKEIQVASRHRNFNIDLAYDIWMDDCISEWKPPASPPSPFDMPMEEWSRDCDGSWSEMIERFDHAIRFHRHHGNL